MSNRTGGSGILEVSEIRSIVMDTLRNSLRRGDSTIPTEQLPKMILNTGAEQGKLPRSDIDVQGTPNERRIIDVIGMLVNEGIITWGSSIGFGVFNTSNMSITEYGQKILRKEEASNPHDTNNYLRRFKERVPTVGEITWTYLEESVYCYIYGRYFASSVMLGVSSEAAFEELYDALTDFIGGSDKTRLEKLRDKIDTREKFDTAMDILKKEKNRFPPNIKNMIEQPLQSLFNNIRMQRNDSGHPTGKTPDREEILTLLAVFPRHCENIYNITKWLRDNKP